MEKIKVNMNPNPLDVQTIHASQNDGEARQWEFELHNNGDVIDSSEISDQLVFKAYKGGTEQILPENGAVPVTTPFVGDIKYPDATRTDQEFLYRQSPTEEDGLAKITDIKGNTLGWNQLCKTLTSGNWAIVGAGSGTLTFADGVATFSTTNNFGRFLYTPGNLVSGHKYLLSVEIKAYANARIIYALGSQNTFGSQGCVCSTGNVQDDNWHRYTSIGTFTSGTDDKVLVQNNSGASNLHEIQVRNIMYFDLTQMGLDITEPSEFTSLFPLSYYSYNQGSLLSFNGNGIKTTGKNRWDSTRLYGDSSSATLNDGVYTKNANGSNWILNTELNSRGAMPVLFEANQSIVLSYKIENSTVNSAFLCVVFEDGTTQNFPNAVNGFTTVLPKKVITVGIVLYGTFTANSSKIYDIQLEIGTTATSYEPYTSSTLSLPISTYFPNGMKSAGSVYDELTETGYAERTVYIKFDGTQPWSTRTTSGGSVLYEFVPSDIKNVGTQATAQISNNIYPWNTNLSENATIRQVNTTISVRRDDITSLQAWYSELANNPLEVVYKLATPTETSFSTASLVTENAEIPLSNNDGTLIGKCTEELSAQPGFIDAKIKLTDGDGTCYSNKLQLHVERKPS